jgi:TusA-related sulfurtransferase
LFKKQRLSGFEIAKSIMNSTSKIENPKSPDAQIDLRGTPCPLNFVRTKLRLEQMAPGAVLEVWLDAGEPIEQVPDSLKMEGYQILETQFVADEPESGFFAMKVQRPENKEAG